MGYIPRQGDWVALNFDPQAGHEQKGRRPALVVSGDLFNRKTGFAIVCPITRTDRAIPLHVKIPQPSALAGFVLTDQLKSVDYRTRKAAYIERASEDLMEEVLAVVETFFQRQ